jgi:acetyl-CoA acetyltransferase
MDDIDGLATYPGGLGYTGMSEGGITAVQSALGLNPTWFSGGMETFGPTGSIISAMMAVATGLARHVLCFRTVWESTYSELVKQGVIQPAGGRTTGAQYVYGATAATHTLALVAQRYFHKYGATRETLGWIAMNQRANAALNPTAIYRDPMTMDDYLSARLITTPFGLFDCDVPCDASTAVIVSAVDAARDLPRPPVYVEAVGTQVTERLEWDQSTLTHEPQVLGQAAHLWSRTSMRPSDVDVAELYDGFTINCLSWIEGLGFCGIGEAKDFLEGGKNIARDGVLPLNTHGGQLSHGRTHGMGLLHEAITQLRGDGGARQIPEAKVAVVAAGGLTTSGVLLLRGAA